MSTSDGKKLLHYVLVEKIGVGGMGEVWRANDTTLGRDVAIKMLPEELAADPERLARFDREARVLASMNHPNIAGIHGLHAADGVRFLAMEFVAGQELAERIATGAIPVEDAVPIAIQIATALEYAHERGIVHRDLKPANVKITPGGDAKVLDFGLAKALTGDGDDPAMSASMPTITSAGTRMGTILGTAAYMSPEQARGRPVDRRTDIWAFGCVLYEMLSGRRAFEGETASDTIAAVLRQDVDWSALPANTPADLQRLLRRCLTRDPRQRLHDIADARIQLEEIRDGRDETEAAGAATASSGSRRSFLPWIAGAFLVGNLAGAGIGMLRPTSKPKSATSPPTSFRQLTTSAGGEAQPSLAPDGQSFAYVKSDGRQSDIFAQRVDGRNAINLTADCSEDDEQPAFSPDGQRIAFRSERSGGGIFVMGATGENVRRVADFGFNPAWSPDGRELAMVTESLEIPWGRTAESRLWAVNVESGERRLITECDAMQPSWSPDGKRIVFWGIEFAAASSQRDLWTVGSDGTNTKPDGAVRLTNDPHLDWSPTWAPDGNGLYFSSSRGGTINLWHLPVDPASGRARGEATPLTAPSSWVGWLSVSHRGDRLAFVDRNARTTVHRAPYDPVRGEIAGPVLPIPLGTTEVYDRFDLSPDGESVLFSNSGVPQHLFIARADGSEFRQLTDGPQRDRQATFSRDGQWIAFQTNRFPSDIGLIRADGSGLRPAVSDRTSAWYPTWSPDGTRLVVGSQDGPYILDVHATSGPGSTRPLPSMEQGVVFMPMWWSAEGDRIIGEALDLSSNSNRVGSLSLPDGSYRMLTSSTTRASRARLLPDNRRMVYTEDENLLVQDIATGKTHELIVAPAGHRYVDVSLSSDGRWIAFLEVWDESDIWMAEFAPAKPAP